MALLVLGLAVWVVVHLFPSIMPVKREQLITRFGNAYQGVFALLIFTSIALMVFGWKSSVSFDIYSPTATLMFLAKLLVLIGFIFMAAANFANTRIKQYIRHPQLAGVLCWALAHLMANGDSRSLILFGTLAVWCVVSMLMINKRDGEWHKPAENMPLVKELLIPVMAVVLLALVVCFHQYVSGVPLI